MLSFRYSIQYRFIFDDFLAILHYSSQKVVSNGDSLLQMLLVVGALQCRNTSMISCCGTLFLQPPTFSFPVQPGHLSPPLGPAQSPFLLLRLIVFIGRFFPRLLTLFHPEGRRGLGGADPPPPHANAYTRNKSMGGNSDNFCIFLNVY